MKRAKKLWVRLFVNIACIFIFFVLCISLAGKSLFVEYFTYHQQKQMQRCAQEIALIDLDRRESASKALRNLENKHNIAITIFKDERPVYSTLFSSGGGHRPDMDGFDMIINRNDGFGEVIESRSYGDEGKISRVVDKNGRSKLIYTHTPKKGGLTIDVIMEQSLIENSAQLAGNFCIIIACICLAVALVWSVIFARRFTRPVAQMNDIALQMAELNFSRKVTPTGNDEVALLGHSLNRLSDSLSAALAELNERNRSLQDEIDAERRLEQMRKGFVANVSHELKTPIAIIQGYAEGLDGGMSEDEAVRRKYCRIILDESHRMNSLVMSLLELSKYEGGIKLKDERFDLASSLINLADRNQPQLEEKGINIELRFPEQINAVGDRLLTEQVIQNYLSNAASHTPRGGTVALYTEPYLQDSLRVCVYNSGSHIAPEDMESLWQSFWRADKAHSREEGRFGLGLSVVKAIMCAADLDFGVFNTDDGVVFWAQVSPDKE